MPQLTSGIRTARRLASVTIRTIVAAASRLLLLLLLLPIAEVHRPDSLTYKLHLVRVHSPDVTSCRPIVVAQLLATPRIATGARS
jgi:hypothetical protein